MRDDVVTECKFRDATMGYDEGEHYTEYFYVGTVCLFLYGVLPLLWFSWVLKSSKKYGKLYKINVIRAYGALYLRYQTTCPRWELVIMLRKVGFVLTQRLFSRYPTTQLAMFFVLVVVSLMLQCKYQPFLNPHLDQLEVSVLFMILAVLVVASLSLNQVISGATCTTLVVVVLCASSVAAMGIIYRMLTCTNKCRGDNDICDTDSSSLAQTKQEVTFRNMNGKSKLVI